MILRERILQYMKQANQPLTRFAIRKNFPDSANSVDAAIEALRNRCLIKSIGKHKCKVSGKSIIHFAVCKEKPVAPNEGKFHVRIYKDRYGHSYESLEATPICRYTDKITHQIVTKYPAGYAMGVRPIW